MTCLINLGLYSSNSSFFSLRLNFVNYMAYLLFSYLISAAYTVVFLVIVPVQICELVWTQLQKAIAITRRLLQLLLT